jgi:Fungal protein kinase
MPLQGSTAERKLDIGFVDDPKAASADLTCHWSQILVPGELKSNPSLDTASKAWLDLGRYIREVLAAQDTRRFCLGFTICGSVMRLWEFDRVGGIASPPFDINKDGQQSVSVMLGFLWMNQEQLGFDPTIVHLHRALRQAGMNHAVAIPKPFLTLDAKGKRLTFCRFISEWDILDWCRVIFYDEAAINRGGETRFFVTRFPGEKYLDNCLALKFLKTSKIIIGGAISLKLKGPLVTFEKGITNANDNVDGKCYANYVVPELA